MEEQNYAYPRDYEAALNSNFITDEKHSLIAPGAWKDFHFIVPEAAPFFEKDLVVRNVTTGEVLTSGVDYVTTHRFLEASYQTAWPVFGSIMFFDKTLSDVVSIDYRTIGGEWTLKKEEITSIIVEKLADPRTTTWEEVATIPHSFPPLKHEFNINDMVGMGDVKSAIDALAAVIQNNADRYYLKGIIDTKLSQAISSLGRADDQTLSEGKTYTDNKIAQVVNELQEYLQTEAQKYVGQQGLSNYDVSVTVGANGDYDSIGAAIKFLTDWRHNYTITETAGGQLDGAFVKAKITLLSGFVMNEKVVANGVNLSWITIEGEDDVTIIDRNIANTRMTCATEDAFRAWIAAPFAAINCGGPTIAQVFSFSGEQSLPEIAISNNYAFEIIVGYYVEGAGAYGFVKKGCGIKNANTASFYATKGGVIYGADAIATVGKRYQEAPYGNAALLANNNGSVLFENGEVLPNDYIGAAETGMVAQAIDSSFINFRAGDCSNCTTDKSLHSTGNSHIKGDYAFFGVTTGEHQFHAEDLSLISLCHATTGENKQTMAFADTGSLIFLDGADIAKTGSIVRAENYGRVLCSAITFSGFNNNTQQGRVVYCANHGSAVFDNNIIDRIVTTEPIYCDDTSSVSLDDTELHYFEKGQEIKVFNHTAMYCGNNSEISAGALTVTGFALLCEQNRSPKVDLRNITATVSAIVEASNCSGGCYEFTELTRNGNEILVDVFRATVTIIDVELTGNDCNIPVNQITRDGTVFNYY